MKTLHKLQQQLMDLLIRNNDEPLTIRGMQEKLDASSPSVVVHHLRQLEKKRYIKRNPYNPQDYQILQGGPEKEVVFLNLYGFAHCGPNGSFLDGKPIDRIPISTRLLNFPAEEGFLIRAKGDSMLPRINDGDLVIGKRTNVPPDGSVIVCMNNGETLIKKYRKEPMKKDQKIILISYNPAYPPFLAAEDFRIEGEVRGMITQRI